MKKSLILTVLIGLLWVATGVSGQTPETKAFVWEEFGFSLEYPAGWTDAYPIADYAVAFFSASNDIETLESGTGDLSEPALAVIHFDTELVEEVRAAFPLPDESEMSSAFQLIYGWIESSGIVTGEIYPADRIVAEREGAIITYFEDEAHVFVYAIVLENEDGTAFWVSMSDPGDSDFEVQTLFEEILATVVIDDAFSDEEVFVRQWASEVTGTSQYGEDSWSFGQAIGQPDTPQCGDITTAWASESSTGEDSLTLTFEQAVIPVRLNIFQTYTPGSIVRVELMNSETGEVFEVPESADPPGNTRCPGIFRVEVADIETPVDQVTLYLDQRIGGSWNEIDAVELIGTVEAE